MESRLDVTVGYSDDKNTKRAIDQTLERLGRPRDLGLVLVYASTRHDPRRVVAAVRGAVGDVPLVGCSTTGEMCPAGLLQGGIVVAGLRSEALHAAVGHGSDVYRDPGGAARRAISMARARLDPSAVAASKNKLCLLHTAGFTLDQVGVEEDVLAAVREELGEEWLVVGGSAGDDLRFLKNFQFSGDAVFDDAVVMALIATDLDVAHCMAHGFVPTDRSFEVTDATANLVKTIDGRLARDLYAELLGVAPQKLTVGLNLLRMSDKVPKFLMSFSQKVGLTPQKIVDNVPFFTYAIENPFGVQTASRGFVVKVPKTVTPEGYLEFQTRIARGEKLHLMRLDREMTATASARAITRAKEELKSEPRLTLVFECSGRYMYLFREIDALARRIRESTTADIAGFFSSAEQGSMEKTTCQTHNYTTSILAFGG